MAHLATDFIKIELGEGFHILPKNSIWLQKWSCHSIPSSVEPCYAETLAWPWGQTCILTISPPKQDRDNIQSVERQWGTCTHDDAKDGALIDHTEKRHDVTFISVESSNRRKICVQFSTGFWQRKTLSIWASWGIFIENLMRYRELCIHAQNPSKCHKCHSVLFWGKN
jgi:hypothetical protein